ncbi:hypothetical protein C8F01DRAFT_1279645 [Mycena amicta]|nr:hypothetical protein C8F01DRAFT_1279645 [Mycena amicta]
MFKFLQGREPPFANAGFKLSTQTPQPVASDSQLLPLDAEAIEYPDKTLITVSVTGTPQREEQRENDDRYCARHFPGHVVLSPLNVVLARLGSPLLVEKLIQLTQVASNALDNRLKRDILGKFSREFIPSSRLKDRFINGRYWLARLADAATDDNPPLRLDYFHGSDAELPPQHGYKKNRTYDASLRPCAAEISTIFNIFVNVEFTRADPPPVTSNPLVGASAAVGKYQQAITNAVNLLTFQSTRLFVPTRSFHGKGEKTKLFVSILNHECLEFAVVDDCFKSDNFPTVSALLHLFRTASMYQLGYNLLFIYNLSSPPSDLSVGDAVPASVVLPGMQGVVRLNGKRLSPLCSTPFQRSTVVLEGDIHEDGKEPIPVVVKLSFIDDRRLLREKIVVDSLHAADGPAPAYAPKILGAFAGPNSPAVEILGPGNKQTPEMVHRHLELMAFALPRARKFSRQGIFQQSTSSTLFGESFVGLTGTLDTMSVATLMEEAPLPHDDIESAIYVLLKIITQTFKPTKELEGEWSETLDQYHWDDPRVQPGTLRQLRVVLWMKSSVPEATTIGATLNIFRSCGRLATAQFLDSLFSLPLPIGRNAVDSSDYGAVLSSLEDLVEKAIAAVDSVDASSLAREVGA